MYVRIFLGLMAALFGLFAAFAMADPIGLTAGLGVTLGGPNGAYEARGIYGGVSLGAAILCAAGAFRRSMTRPALWFLVVYMGGYVFARAAALLLGPLPTPAYTGFVAFEVAALLAAILCLKALARG